MCVLTLYDRKSQACIAHQAIITTRSQNLINGINNWVTSNPWIMFPQPGGAVCQVNRWVTYLNLATYTFKYIVATYTMNGTFVGFSQLSTLLSYCSRSPPYTSYGNKLLISIFIMFLRRRKLIRYEISNFGHFFLQKLLLRHQKLARTRSILLRIIFIRSQKSAILACTGEISQPTSRSYRKK